MSGIYRGLAALTTKRVGGIQLNTIDNFRVSQNELLQSISDLKVMIQPEFLKVKPNAKTVYETLCSLGDMMKSHLSDEGKNLFPPLLIHEDNKLKSLAWGFITGERPLRKQFDSYYKKWLKDCDFNFTEDFLVETNELFSSIESRIVQEQQVLLPRLEKTGLFSSAESAIN